MNTLEKANAAIHDLLNSLSPEELESILLEVDELPYEGPSLTDYFCQFDEQFKEVCFKDDGIYELPYELFEIIQNQEQETSIDISRLLIGVSFRKVSSNKYCALETIPAIEASTNLEFNNSYISFSARFSKAA